MQFGPLEIAACGENNYTTKTLGLLAFRPDLRRRFVRNVFPNCPPVHEGTNIRIQFFSRIGEDFIREAIESEAPNANLTEVEKRLSPALGLPETFRWARTRSNLLIQPAKWQDFHISAMLKANGHEGDSDLNTHLNDIQDYLNTEPDVVLQWDNHLGIVEIKVLSGEGPQELHRQVQLATLFANLLGWQTHFGYIGPHYGPGPTESRYNFVSWREVAKIFEDIPEIRNYIYDFPFFFKKAWRTMVDPPADQLQNSAWRIVTSNKRSSAKESEEAGAVAGPGPLTVPL